MVFIIKAGEKLHHFKVIRKIVPKLEGLFLIGLSLMFGYAVWSIVSELHGIEKIIGFIGLGTTAMGVTLFWVIGWEMILKD